MDEQMIETLEKLKSEVPCWVYEAVMANVYSALENAVEIIMLYKVFQDLYGEKKAEIKIAELLDKPQSCSCANH